jgi:hypothetical protein
MMNYYPPPPHTHSFLNRSLVLSRQFCHLFLFLLILVTFSCQEFDTNLPGVAIEENDIHYVDIDQAKMIAGIIEFPMPQDLDRSPQNTNQRDFDIGALGTKKIKESRSPLGKGNKALYHIINYEEGGFVIISADDRLPPILAFSYDNEMPFTEESEYPEGLMEWYSDQKKLVEFIRDNPEAEISEEGFSGSITNTSSWNPCPIQKQITPNNISPDPCDPDGGGGCQDQYTQVNPLLNTLWNQRCGFNQLMPTITCNPGAPCGRAFAGCVPVAMAQIMRYHSHPGGYNYANMPNDIGNIHNATLMTDIFNAFPANQRTINCSGTFISGAANFASVFTNSFAYSSASQGAFNSTTVRNNLNQGRPVVLIGTSSIEGHMWVTDGYLRAVFCSGQTLLKLHMNWGWMNGTGNGLFNYNNWTVTLPTGQTFNFNNNKTMVFNIIP